MSRKVYLVTISEYEYCAHKAVFSDREDAEQYAASLDDEDADVEEIDLDPEVPEVRRYFAATVNHRGEVVETDEFWARPGSKRTQCCESREWVMVSSETHGSVTITRRQQRPKVYAVSETSVEDAVAKARAMLTEWKAKEEGV